MLLILNALMQRERAYFSHLSVPSDPFGMEKCNAFNFETGLGQVHEIMWSF